MIFTWSMLELYSQTIQLFHYYRAQWKDWLVLCDIFCCVRYLHRRSLSFRNSLIYFAWLSRMVVAAVYLAHTQHLLEWWRSFLRWHAFLGWTILIDTSFLGLLFLRLFLWTCRCWDRRGDDSGWWEWWLIFFFIVWSIPKSPLLILLVMEILQICDQAICRFLVSRFLIIQRLFRSKCPLDPLHHDPIVTFSEELFQ